MLWQVQRLHLKLTVDQIIHFKLKQVEVQHIDNGLVHVALDGTESTGSDAQGKTSGTLYWQVPANISGNYQYQCTVHGSMQGTIVVKALSAI